MHVLFSMSDEPDLGDEFRTYDIDEPTVDNSKEILLRPWKPTYTNAEVREITSALIRRSIQYQRQAYEDGYNQAKKDMDELEDDLMYAKDALRDVLGWIGCSQSLSALKAICLRGLKE